jgi:mycothiol synthase
VPLTAATSVPDDATAADVRALAASVEQVDGAPPLSDQALSQLRSPDTVHVVMRADAELVGYAQRAGESLEVVAAPQAVGPLLDATAVGEVRIWSHGRHSRLAPVLAERGFRSVRELLQLRRPLDAEHPLPPDPPLADGVAVRAFVPGRDDEAWLAVNAAAFAHHPEQGGWTAGDLQARVDSDWFDPAGFLLAERDGELLGYHWTKVHPDGLGEVYVLGVAPAAQGLGLGSALLVRGLHHLADRGCPAVLLYVEGDNAGALSLYRKAGFTEFDVDVQWAPPSD